MCALGSVFSEPCFSSKQNLLLCFDSALECLKYLCLALYGYNPSSFAWKFRPLVVSISSLCPNHPTSCCSCQTHLLIFFHMCLKLSYQDDGSLLTRFPSFLQAVLKIVMLVLELVVNSPTRSQFSLLDAMVYLMIFYLFHLAL